MKTFRLSSLFIGVLVSACVTEDTSSELYSPIIYQGTDKAVLPSVLGLKACRALLKKHSKPEARAALTFKPGPSLSNMPEEVITAANSVLGACESPRTSTMLTTMGWITKESIIIYK